MPSEPPLPCLWMESTESQAPGTQSLLDLGVRKPRIRPKDPQRLSSASARQAYPEGISSPSSAVLDISESRKQEPLNSS